MRVPLMALLSIATSVAFADATSCFVQRPPFFSVFQGWSALEATRSTSVSLACAELENPEMQASIERSEMLGILRMRLTIAGQGGVLAPLVPLDLRNPLQAAYADTIASIRRTASPMERVRLAYELAARHSGSYDVETMGDRHLRANSYVAAEWPSRLLLSFERDGSIGTCQEFASLLHWTLQQVKRSTASTRDEFNTAIMVGAVPTGLAARGDHAWVRVHLASGAVFDLDTVFNQTAFAPLYPRRTGRLRGLDRQWLARECRAVQACLN